MTPEQSKIYQAYWDTAVVNNSDVPAVNQACAKIKQNILRYNDVSKETGIPALLIAVIHMRESSFNFHCHLANGDPLNSDTTHVPANIMKPLPPPYSWEEAAIAALNQQDKGWSINPATFLWEIPGSLWYLEAYNGFGNAQHGIPTPYLWSFTNLYTKGGYGSDGKWDPSFVDRNCGSVPVLKALGYTGGNS